MSEITRKEFLRITAVAGVSVALGGSLTSALVKGAGLHRIRETRTRIGTIVTITVVHPDAAAARHMVTEAFDEMERLEDILSRHRAETPLARLNREGQIFDAPVELQQVVRASLDYSATTGGAFDITVAPLVNLYRSRFAAAGRPPAESEVEQARELVGHQRVLVDGSSIRFATRGMAITLDGIAKGYVVDRTVEQLKAQGAERVLVAASGDMSSVNQGWPDDGWEIGVQNPRDQAGLIGLLRIHGQSLATSGDYQEYFTPDKRFHHIIDPRSGTSPERTSAVTVVAPKAMDADALATGVFVLGPADGLVLLDRLTEVEGMIVDKELRVVRSNGMNRYSA
ncbi:MAG: FAD:protein FMN transferase [Gemmatimonadetes bacterium]|nr:FAD:protein FMN transferase [Gemmatimonadota bacterium]